jgi:phosphate ABC transporter phosphate-binding protein
MTFRASVLRKLKFSLALFFSGLIVASGGVTAFAADYVPISGAGSSWSANAVDQWRRNVTQYGMRVNYASTGSVDGRNQFKGGTVDFAVTETPYGLRDNGVTEPLPNQGFAYMPIVAGGTAFMYNLTSGGQRITNLRLSGETISKMFTGEITKWNDKEIADDNPGLTLPDRKVVPVVRSDGSGSTAQFTLWMSKQHSSIWDAYCRDTGRSTPCGLTSFYPTKSGMVAQPGSQGVSGYVAQKANEGTITYVEYSYALKTGYPVAKLLNKAGYFTEPTAKNVAVALLGAKINTTRGDEYLTQILDGVYNNKDPRTYALSSYSYMVVPTEAQGAFTEAKGKTLSAFSNYFLCEGQQQADVLGYSPLPINLVKAGLDQVKLIPGAETGKVNINKCNNPTLDPKYISAAPMPAECDKVGTTQCTTGTGGASNTSTTGSTGTTGTTDGTTTGITGGITGGIAGGVGGTMGTGPTQCDVDTGICSSVKALPIATTSTGWGPTNWIIVSVIVILVLVIAVPPIVVTAAARKRR